MRTIQDYYERLFERIKIMKKAVEEGNFVSSERTEHSDGSSRLDVVVNKGVRFKEQSIFIFYSTENKPYMWSYRSASGSGGGSHNMQELKDLRKLLLSLDLED